jgi:putative aminopeptidase FrvX
LSNNKTNTKLADMDFSALKELCSIHAPSGEEYRIKDYLLAYIEKHQGSWACKPVLLHGPDYQDCLVMVFGEPSCAVYAHMDSVGFTAKYGNELVKIGSPRIKNGYLLCGTDSNGRIEAKLRIDEENDTIYADCHRPIEPGTSLVFRNTFTEDYQAVKSSSLDNRLGIWICLQLAQTMQNGAIAFTAWEEHGGGSAQNIARILYEKYELRQALISDITWITDGIEAGKGCAISLRDSGIPRRRYLDKILGLARHSGAKFQIEVESAGGSDGNTLQHSPYPIDWCFIGAGELNVHSPEEQVNKQDIFEMLKLYEYITKHL